MDPLRHIPQAKVTVARRAPEPELREVRDGRIDLSPGLTPTLRTSPFDQYSAHWVGSACKVAALMVWTVQTDAHFIVGDPSPVLSGERLNSLLSGLPELRELLGV